jgi:hypothetical protein
MTTAEAAPRVEDYELIETIRTYVNSHRHSRYTEERWLCTYLEPVVKLVQQIHDRRLSDENKREVGKFRAAELAEQIAAKRKETAALESELTKYAGL